MSDHPPRRGIHRRVARSAAVLLLVAAWWPVSAMGGDIFQVSGVEVDVTAETAAAAREQALREGEVLAFRRLLERLTLRVDYGALPRLGFREIESYVKDFSVEQEKTSSVRYLARLNVRFKPEDMRRLLIESGLPFAETPSKPVLVLPVFQAIAALLLWDDPNPWFEAWKALPSADGLVPLLLPLGDLADIAAIGAEQAIDGDTQRLDAVSQRYAAGETLVARAILGIEPRRGTPRIEVYVTRYGSGLDQETTVSAFAAEAGESRQALLDRAAAEVARQIEDAWKEATVLHFDDTAVIAVTVPIDGLAAWLTVRRRLTSVAAVRKVDLVLLSRDEVRINLHYIGEPEQLILALEQTDLVLREESGSWFLEPAGASASARDS
jgi:hypothetical protein